MNRKPADERKRARPEGPGTEAARLHLLLRADHPLVLVETLEEVHACRLVRQAAREQNLAIQAWTLSRGIHDPDFLDGPAAPGTEAPDAALRHLLKSDLGRTLVLLVDLVVHLEEPSTLRLLRDLVEAVSRRKGHVVLVDADGRLPAAVRQEATRFELHLPGEKELEELVRETVDRERSRLKGPIRLTPAVFKAFVRNLGGLTRRQARQVVLDVLSDDGEFTPDDLNHAMAVRRGRLQEDGVLEYVETPITLESVAGMSALKAWLAERKGAFSEEGRLYGLVPPRGLLMLGVPGSGKSLCAKAVASAWERPLFRLDPSALYDKYIGESERRLRETLRAAEALSPAVLWIDEIEKGFAGASSRSIDGGLSQRMFGSLLTWMQEHRAPVFVIATANDIEALPAELLRKGRFDEIFFVDLPAPAVRHAIVEVHLRKQKFDPAAFDLDALAAASEGCTGAEIEQSILSAMHESFAARRKMSAEDVVRVLHRSPPLSVTMKERVDALRAWARGRCSPAD